jgi:ketosteroid isomerase-like protein
LFLLDDEEIMKFLSVSLMTLLFVSPAAAGPREEAFIVEQFKKAFDAADIFMSGSMQGPTHDPEVILKAFQAAAVNKPRKITIENYGVLQLSEIAVLFSGQDVFSQTKEGQVIDTPARLTFVITKGSDGWGIAHPHSSMRPPKPQ